MKILYIYDDACIKKNIYDNSRHIEKKNIYILNKAFFAQPKEITFRSISIILKKISGNYYAPRGKSILESISKINSAKFHKFTLGGCCIDKANGTILINKEKHQ